MVIDDATKDPRLVECRPILQEFDIHSLLAFPLLYKSRMIGLILVHRCKSLIQWSEPAKTIFSTVAGHLAVAINSARVAQSSLLGRCCSESGR